MQLPIRLRISVGCFALIALCCLYHICPRIRIVPKSITRHRQPEYTQEDTMATNTRSYGANARQLDWDDNSQDRSRTGSWMPLDGLDDDLFTSPQLQAVAVAPVISQPRRSAPSLPWRREEARA